MNRIERRVLVANTHKPGTEINFRTARYVVATDGSYRSEHKRLTKTEKKAARKARTQLNLKNRK